MRLELLPADRAIAPVREVIRPDRNARRAARVLHEHGAVAQTEGTCRSRCGKAVAVIGDETRRQRRAGGAAAAQARLGEVDIGVICRGRQITRLVHLAGRGETTPHRRSRVVMARVLNKRPRVPAQTGLANRPCGLHQVPKAS